jgi:hypothetical protein
MPRQKRADEADAIYHALNRGNARQPLFRKDADYEAFLRVGHGTTSGTLQLRDPSVKRLARFWHCLFEWNTILQRGMPSISRIELDGQCEMSRIDGPDAEC